MSEKIDGAAPVAAPDGEAVPATMDTAEADARQTWDELDAADKAASDKDQNGKDPAPPAEPGSNKEGDGETPSSRDTETGQFAAKSKAESGQEKAPGDELWKDAPEPLRQYRDKTEAELKDLRHFRSSQVGRTASFQRRIGALEQENARLKASGAAGGNAKETGRDEAGEKEPTKGTKGADGKPARDPKLQRIADEYPEIATPMLELIEDQRDTIKGLNDKVAALTGRASEDVKSKHIEAQTTALTDVHPDWLDITGAPGGNHADETARATAANQFTAWLEKQPGYVQEAARQNGEYVVDAAAAIDLIDRFKAHQRGANQPTPSPNPGDPKPSGATPKPGPSPKRQHQLDSAAAPVTPAPGIARDGIPDEPEAAWNYFERKGL